MGEGERMNEISTTKSSFHASVRSRSRPLLILTSWHNIQRISTTTIYSKKKGVVVLRVMLFFPISNYNIYIYVRKIK